MQFMYEHAKEWVVDKVRHAKTCELPDLKRPYSYTQGIIADLLLLHL